MRTPLSGGFTIVELMVAIAVVGIILGIAAPSFTGLINANRISAATNEWLATIQVARMESVRRNARVVICPSTNGSTCTGGDWTRAIAFVDVDGDGSAGGAGETVLRDTSVKPPVLVSASAAISGASPANRITMRADGLARPGNATTVLSAKIGVCMVTTNPALNARRISLSGSRVSVDPAVTSATCATPANTP